MILAVGVKKASTTVRFAFLCGQEPVSAVDPALARVLTTGHTEYSPMRANSWLRHAIANQRLEAAAVVMAASPR